MSSQPQGNDSTGSNQNPHRRASFSPGSSLSEFLSSSRQPAPTTAYPGPITTAAAQANSKRRMSMSSVSNSPPSIQTSFPFRRGSVSSTSSANSNTDESAIDDSEPSGGSPTNVGNSPFARRMSWGARALRDVRVPAQRNSVAFTPTSPSASSPTVARGFAPDSGRNAGEQPYLQRRRQSVSVMPPASSFPSAKEHDPLQERILKGELYMD